MTDPIDYDALARAIDRVNTRNQDRDRDKPETMTVTKVEEIVKRVVSQELDAKISIAITKTISETLIGFNLDPLQRTEIQRDMLFIRDMRELSAGSKKHVIYAVLTALVGAIITAVVFYMKAQGKV